MLLKPWRNNWVAGLVVGLVVVVGLLLGVREVARQCFYASIGYCVEAEFATLPADDKLLCDWMTSRPGVVSHNVYICRVGPVQKTLRVMFIQVRNPAGSPPFPDLEGQCAALGYSGLVGKFRRSTDQSCSCDACPEPPDQH